MDFTKNWKTTVSGALTIATGIASLAGVGVGGAALSPDAAIGLILGGIGLIFAKDGNVTGGSVKQ